MSEFALTIDNYSKFGFLDQPYLTSFPINDQPTDYILGFQEQANTQFQEINYNQDELLMNSKDLDLLVTNVHMEDIMMLDQNAPRKKLKIQGSELSVNSKESTNCESLYSNSSPEISFSGNIDFQFDFDENLKEKSLVLEKPMKNDIKLLIVGFHKFYKQHANITRKIIQEVLKKYGETGLEGVITKQVVACLEELVKRKSNDKANYRYASQTAFTQFFENLLSSSELGYLLYEILYELRLDFVCNRYENWLENLAATKCSTETTKTHVRDAKPYFVARFCEPKRYLEMFHKKKYLDPWVRQTSENLLKHGSIYFNYY